MNDLVQKQEEQFATSLNPNARFGLEAPSFAKFNVQQAYATGLTPEKAASDANLARKVGTTPEYLLHLKPEDKAAEQVNALDWAQLHNENPVLMKMMDDPTFAAEVSDDPREAGMLERLHWWLSPDPGQRGGFWRSFRNMTARGMAGMANSAPLIGNESVLEHARKELLDISEKEAALAGGKTIAEIFGTEEDPTGKLAYSKWEMNKERIKQEANRRMIGAAEGMAWVNRTMPLFPMSRATEAMFAQDTAAGAAEAFLSNPFLIAMEVGGESMLRQLPQLVALGATAGLGAVPAALATGATSMTLERGARQAESMTKYGLQTTNPLDILRWYSSEYKAQYDQMDAINTTAAQIIGALDAAGGGLMSKTIVPKGFLGMSERMSRVSNVVAQSATQSVLGGAGEAGAQIATEGKITSWADIIAEMAGEGLTGPVEVAVAAFSRNSMNPAVLSAVQEYARNTAEAEAVAKASTLLANDPQSGADYVRNVAKSKAQGGKVPDLFVDVQSMHQEGQDNVILEASPELAERYKAALDKGEHMKVSAEEVLTVIAPRDTNNVLAEALHAQDMPSLAEARNIEARAAESASERLSQTLKGKDKAFVQSSAEMGKLIETQMDEAYGDNIKPQDGGMSKAMRKVVQTFLQTMFNTIAKDLGITPMEAYQRYGATAFLTPADIERTPEGTIKLKSERAKKIFAKKTEAAVVSQQKATETVGATPTETTQTVTDESHSQGIIGDWFPDIRAIATWVGSNRSTFLHETGHMFLDMRVRIAQELLAKRESGAELTTGEKHLLETAEATMAWLGTDIKTFASMSIKDQRPMHEKFARTYEAYLMEGNAPNRSLTNLFRSFSSWLRNIYHIVSNIPEAEINPEVRALFDSLFVASTEVEIARQRRAQFTNYDDPNLAGIAIDMGEDLAELQKESGEAAVEEMQKRLNRAARITSNIRKGMIKDLSEQAQEIYKRISDEEWDKLVKSPVYQAFIALTEGINEVKPKLTEKDIANISPKLTETQIEFLRAHEMVGKNKRGVNALMVAQRFGYASVDEMVFAILNMGKAEDYVQASAAERMLEEYPEIATPESIEHMADISIFNDARLRILAIEARAYQEALGKKGDVIKAVKNSAETAVGLMKIADLDTEVSVHAAASGRCGEQAKYERAKGNVVSAAAAKVRELYQASIVNVINDVNKQYIRGVKFFNRFSDKVTMDSCDVGYLMAIQHILDRIKFRDFPKAGAGQRVSLKDFVTKINEEAKTDESTVREIEVSESLVNQIDSGALTMETMSVAQFQAIEDLVRQLYALGNDLATIEVDGQRVELEAARRDVAQGVLDNATKKGKKILDNRERIGQINRIKESLSKIGLAHARIPSLLNCIEGVMPGSGKFFKYVVRKFDECGNREAAMNHEITVALSEILKPLYKDLAKQKPRTYTVQIERIVQNGNEFETTTETKEVSFTKQEVFTMALNMGNEGNIQRLVDNSNGWTFMRSESENVKNNITYQGFVSIIQQTLTADELRRVQAIWDLFDTLKTQVEAKEIRVRGRAPAWVEALPISLTTADNQVVHLKGGYYPIVYDKNASGMGQKNAETQRVLQEMKAAKGQASTYKGHLKDRKDAVSASSPLTLTLRGAYEGFENTIHDVCWDEWVTSTRRLFGNGGKLSNTIRDYYGPDTVKAIEQWIHDSATGRNTQTSMGDDLAVALRKNISLVGIGFNLVTAAIQTVGITQTVVALGSKWTLNGVGEMMTRSPFGAYKYAASKSLLIQDRLRTQFRELAEVQRYTSSGGNKVFDGLARVAYTPVALVQMMVDLPTWIGAYNKAISEGKAEAEAIAIADRTLIEAQGSGRFQDLSTVERGHAWAQLFTVFYTFFNTTYNLCRLTMNAKSGLAAARDLTLLLVAQPVIETFLREALAVKQDDGEDDDAYWDRMQSACMSNVANFNMSMFVIVREAAGLSNLLSEEPVNYRGPTGTKKITDVMRWGAMALKEWSREDEIDPAFIRQTITVFAEVTNTPIPVVPINRYLRGKQAIDEGDTSDWKAYLFGYSKK